MLLTAVQQQTSKLNPDFLLCLRWQTTAASKDDKEVHEQYYIGIYT
jgi:hypothetical protein